MEDWSTKERRSRRQEGQKPWKVSSGCWGQEDDDGDWGGCSGGCSGGGGGILVTGFISCEWEWRVHRAHVSINQGVAVVTWVRIKEVLIAEACNG
ncbi:hypothetical protein Hanom_Chr13g01194311 [Helianthus anomalus]